MAAVATFLAPLRRLHAGVNATPMPYEPGTTECRVLIDSKAQIEAILLNLARLENTSAIRQQLVSVHNQLEELHEQRRQERSAASVALL